MADRAIEEAGLDLPAEPEKYDKVQPISGVSAKSKEMSRCQFAANLFRQLETSYGNIGSFAGETLPPAAEYSLGAQDGFKICANIMERLAAIPRVYADQEKVRAIADVVKPILDALIDAKLTTSLHMMGTPELGDIISAEDSSQDRRQPE